MLHALLLSSTALRFAPTLPRTPSIRMQATEEAPVRMDEIPLADEAEFQQGALKWSQRYAADQWVGSIKPTKPMSAATAAAAPASKPKPLEVPNEGWGAVVNAARGRAAAVKAGQDETTAAAVLATLVAFNLPTIDNAILDFILCTVFFGLPVGYLAGFQEGPVGDAVRTVGGAVAGVGNAVGSKLDDFEVIDKLKASMPSGGSLSMDDIKKFGVAGTLAYILTELAFWIVAFPVASTTFYNTAGHWPDFADGSDRTAVLAFIFAGANVARLAVPLRFGAAFALAPWVDENIVMPVQARLGKDD